MLSVEWTGNLPGSSVAKTSHVFSERLQNSPSALPFSFNIQHLTLLNIEHSTFTNLTTPATVQSPQASAVTAYPTCPREPPSREVQRFPRVRARARARRRARPARRGVRGC